MEENEVETEFITHVEGLGTLESNGLKACTSRMCRAVLSSKSCLCHHVVMHGVKIILLGPEGILKCRFKYLIPWSSSLALYPRATYIFLPIKLLLHHALCLKCLLIHVVTLKTYED